MLRNASKTELQELIGQHCQKPEKVPLFMGALEKMLVNGQLIFKPTWSWWAFFFSWAYFLYRKLYLWAAVFFLVNVITGMVGLNLLVMVAAGISAKYLYLKKFTDDLQVAGFGSQTFVEVKSNMRQLGGYHNWVVVLILLLAGIALLSALMALLAGGM
ncbi:hypothetical protein Selin_0547 [Desulfurispirillum indicum S5]|uniref:DUF2628 domain-containing protein n=1 Tax=Desulfurispirillum indicum (strain ATCC BAA-1389 / DSM 22839 / S5) TaxID=653733 RepID=E6W0W3_DESIS|nr:DUF2628 domain-containing protein [Desulfurispirillum indicum]ADU65295.1 hypothetical protein Selin_0547 [Desulfurispirillum indicum S5]